MRSRSPATSRSSGVQSELPANGQPAEAPDLPDGLTDDATGHLALADVAIDEHDRDLAESEVAAPGAEAHLDLEGIAVRLDSIEWDGGEHLPAKTFETTGEVRDGYTGDPARVDVGEVAQEETSDGPVDDGDASFEVP
jgi:hypothetical protein